MTPARSGRSPPTRPASPASCPDGLGPLSVRAR
nr:MAG TPA: hypothetical protein [Caudoviricetes sp.]